MAEAQNLSINLDANSINILKKVDAIHRDSLINVGLALVSKTGYYKTLTGIADSTNEKLDEVTSLEVLDEDGDKPVSKKASKKAKAQEAEAPAKKPASSWDAF